MTQDVEPSRKGIAAFALSHPHFIIVACLTIVLLGGLAVVRLPKDLLPASNFPAVQILSFYTGMPVDYVEKSLTARYERFTGQAIGIIRQESRSLVGVSVVKNFFNANVDLNTAIAQTTSLTMSVMSHLPPGTQPPIILPFDPMAAVPLALVAVATDQFPKELYDAARYDVRNAIQSIPGAMAPTVMGGAEREVVIYANPRSLNVYNFSPLKVIDKVTRLNTFIPAGDVKIGNWDYQILSNALVDKPSEMNDFPLRSENGVSVYLRDIGRAEDTSEIQTNVVLINGKEQVYVPIYRQPGANSLQIVDDTREALKKLSQLKEGFNFSVVADQSVFIRHAIHSIGEEAFVGGGLAALLVFLFLGDAISTVGVVLSLSLSLFCAFLGLSAVGETLNAMTLGGLALCIGVLVDNSIVVLENISKKLDSGMNAKNASLLGSTEVAPPVLASTLATIVVFIPVIFLKGIVKILFSSLAKSVVFAMIGSYFAAMGVIPLFAAYALKGNKSEAKVHRGLLGFVRKAVDGLTKQYRQALSRALNHRALILGGCGLLLVGGFFLAKHVGTELFPRADSGNFVLEMRLPTGTRIEKTAVFAKEIDAKLREWIDPHDLRMIIANAGVYYGYPAAFTPNSGTQDVFFLVDLTEERQHTSQYWVERVRDHLAQDYPSVETGFELGGLLSSALNGGLRAPIDVQIQGPSSLETHRIADELASKMKTLRGAVDVRVQQKVDAPAFLLSIDRKKAGVMGLTSDEVVKNVSAAVSGSAAFKPAIWIDPKSGIDYFVTLEFPEAKVAALADLERVPITGENQDRSIPLSEVATIAELKVPSEVNHVNLSAVVDIWANAQGRDVGGLSEEIQSLIRDMNLPKGYSATIRGEISEMQRAVQSLGGGFLLAAIMVYLILVVQFESFILPLIMMVAVPLGIVGVVLMLAVTHTYFSIQAAIGAIFMIGIAVANGVLIIEFIQHHMGEHGVRDAILHGASARLRPIMMTAMASILGLVPMALGVGHGSEANIPLGRAVIGGQLLSTVLTLFVVPILFSLVKERKSTAPSPAAARGASVVVLLVLLLAATSNAQSTVPVPPPDLSVAQVLRMAENASPDLKAAIDREHAAEQNIRIFQSFYYPTFNLEAIDSFGFPGSSRDLGVSGLMGSPYRSGPAAGVSADLALFDLGRTHAVQTAKKELDAIRARTDIIRYQVDQRALQIFLEASRFRGQQETSKEIAGDILLVEKEVDRFVKTGQRSVVERLLVHDQTSDADMTAAEFQARYQVALERLAVVTTSSGTLSCPTPQMISEQALGLMKGGGVSPLVLQAAAEAVAARTAISQYSAQNYPKILATASVGDMDKARLVPEKNYSGGFGFEMPLFAGYKIDATIRQAQALASARDADQMAVRMDVDQINARYDEVISGSRVKLSYLETELDDAKRAFALAKQRYVSFQGTLVDVREALRNLSRVTAELIDVKSDLLLASGSKQLLNGARVQ